MTHVICRLTAKNWYQLRKPTLGNQVWATLTFFTANRAVAYLCRQARTARDRSRQERSSRLTSSRRRASARPSRASAAAGSTASRHARPPVPLGADRPASESVPAPASELRRRRRRWPRHLGGAARARDERTSTGRHRGRAGVRPRYLVAPISKRPPSGAASCCCCFGNQPSQHRHSNNLITVQTDLRRVACLIIGQN